MPYFKAFIRVVKSLSDSHILYNNFSAQNIIEERLIEADNKEHVKELLLEKYPQFFPNNKVYSKETKDDAQFFYVVIFELYQHEIEKLNNSNWKCDHCGQQYVNTYLYPPRNPSKLFPDKKFCKSEDDYCLEQYKIGYYKDIEHPDDEFYINKQNLTFIYKITEKQTGKSYIGKTKNAPFFRWWNHLTHSSSPFGLYLRSTKLCDWTFEVLEILEAKDETEVFEVETKYMVEYESIKNGFNSLVSNNKIYKNLTETDKNQIVFKFIDNEKNE